MAEYFIVMKNKKMKLNDLLNIITKIVLKKNWDG